MARNEEERPRAFGVRTGPGPSARQGEEQQHALGLPADWFGNVDVEWFRSLLHPIKGYQRWARRRRLGPYAVDEDPQPKCPS